MHALSPLSASFGPGQAAADRHRFWMCSSSRTVTSARLIFFGTLNGGRTIWPEASRASAVSEALHEFLRAPGFAKRGSRLIQRSVDLGRLGMRLSEDSLPQRCDGFERLHCLAEIVEVLTPRTRLNWMRAI